MQLRIYNSLTRSLEPFEPELPGRARLYVCGITTYDYCHIGHARAMLTFDMVYRVLRFAGYEVTYVRNYTDVDDKIIERAHRVGEDPLALSARFCQLLDEDLAALGLVTPQVQPKVSTHIPHIVALIERIIARGHAYAADGDVYFSVKSFPTYGQLSGKKVGELIAGERVEVRESKRDPADFALWKAAKPGEVSWPSPWGPGRPGWHIECSAMSMEYLGESFDIHGGGIDLIFPHHENEIAQSEAATGHAPFARMWMHNGHVTLVRTERSGDEVEEKMSKSLGNVITIREILKQVPAEALRLIYLGSHYRSPLPWSSERLAEAVGLLDRLYTARETVEQIAARGGAERVEVLVRELGEDAALLQQQATGFRDAFVGALEQDFNTSEALSHLLELVRTINRLGSNPKARKRGGPLFALAQEPFALCGEVLGIGGRTPQDWFEQVRAQRLAARGLGPADVEALIAQRAEARAAKDWARADALRAQLEAMDVVVMDTPEGVQWRMKVE